MKIFYMGKRIDNQVKYNPKRTSHGHFSSFKSACKRFLKRAMIVVSIAFAIYLSGIIGSIYGTPTIVQAPVIAHADTPKLPEILQKIAKCESGSKQFENGQVIARGNKNGSVDYGKYQINLQTWAKQATILGYDLATEKGNEGFAVWLFNTYGSDPWSASMPCVRKG